MRKSSVSASNTGFNLLNWQPLRFAILCANLRMKLSFTSVFPTSLLSFVFVVSHSCLPFQSTSVMESSTIKGNSAPKFSSFSKKFSIISPSIKIKRKSAEPHNGVPPINLFLCRRNRCKKVRDCISELCRDHTSPNDRTNHSNQRYNRNDCDNNSTILLKYFLHNILFTH